MNQPDLGSVHVDSVLTNVSVAAMNADETFVAEKVFPVVNVKKESDVFFTFTKSFLFRPETRKIAAGGAARIRGYDLSTSQYVAEKFGVAILVPDRIRDNADSPLSPLEDATRIISHDLQIFKEDHFADQFLVTAAWTSEDTLSGTTQWSDFDDSDPVTAIDEDKRTIAKRIGKSAQSMTLVLGAEVADKLKRHPSVIGAFGGGNPGLKVATLDMMKNLFGVKQILVSESVQNTNIEGASSQTNTQIFGKLALLCYIPDNPGLMEEAAGYFMTKQRSQIRRYRWERRESEVVEIGAIYDFKQVDADAGHLYIDAVA